MVRRAQTRLMVAFFVLLTFTSAPLAARGQKVSPSVYFDISWDEVAKYLVTTPESVKNAADMANRYPDRFLFGTDEVAPPDQEKYLKVYNQYEPFWKLLTPQTSEKIRKENYVRIFDDARRKVPSWEAAHVK